jgi:hypothetical protein
MYFKRYPFENKQCAHKNEAFYRLIHKGQYKEFWDEEKKYLGINDDVPLAQGLLNLIIGMLLPNPKDRYSIAQIRNDPWFLN